MNACEANVVEALLHAGATRTTGLAVPCDSRQGHGEDGVMVAPQSLGALAECPLLRCCAECPQHVARAWSSEFRPRGTAAGIRTRRPREMRNGVRDKRDAQETARKAILKTRHTCAHARDEARSAAEGLHGLAASG